MQKVNLLLLPGYDGSGYATFSKLIKVISPKIDCYTLDYPYCQTTSKAYSMLELQNYIHQFARKNIGGKYHLLGFSMGGFVAVEYAKQYTTEVQSLVLVSSSIRPLLAPLFQKIAGLAYVFFRFRPVAWLFTLVYRSAAITPIANRTPLPQPNKDFPLAQGFPLFSTLANVIHSVSSAQRKNSRNYRNIPKYAILFQDDLSFPAKNYRQQLHENGFIVHIEKNGGHAVAQNYWSTVSKRILPLFE